MSSPRPCLGAPGEPCGIPTINAGGRCDEHRTIVERTRHNPAYDTREHRRASRTARREHVKLSGWTCPGYGRAPHPSRDLTLDHPDPLARGGAIVQHRRPVLCRGCNTRRRNAMRARA